MDLLTTDGMAMGQGKAVVGDTGLDPLPCQNAMRSLSRSDYGPHPPVPLACRRRLGVGVSFVFADVYEALGELSRSRDVAPGCTRSRRDRVVGAPR